MLFLPLLTLTYAGTNNFVTPRRVVEIDDAEFSFEDGSREMEFAMTEDAVENLGDIMEDDFENINDMTVDAVNLTNMTEVPRRRMRWSQCVVYKGTHTPHQYLYLHGRCRHIQSGYTIHNWYGRSVYRTIWQWTMNSCPKGEPIKPGAWLAKGDRSLAVYAIYNGKKHHIANPNTMSRCGFNWGQVVTVPQRVVDGYNRGPTILA